MPFVKWFSQNALGKGYFTDLNATGPAFIGSREDMNGSTGLYASSNQAYIKLLKPVVMSQGDYVGISLPQATRIENFAVADTLWEHYEVLCSTNGKQWMEIRKDEPLPIEHIKYVVFVNPSAEARLLKLARPITAFSWKHS